MRLKISKLIIESQKFKITERMLKISESKVRKIFKSICQLYEIGMKTSKIDDENTKMIFFGSPEAIFEANILGKFQSLDVGDTFIKSKGIFRDQQRLEKTRMAKINPKISENKGEKLSK